MEIDVKRGRNNQLWDLGLEAEKMEEDQDVKDKIIRLDDEMDQVIRRIFQKKYFINGIYVCKVDYYTMYINAN